MKENMKLNIYYVGHNTMYNNFYKCCDLEECYNYLKNKEVISLDIETSYKFGGKYKKEGLDPYLSNIVMLQIGDEDRQYIIDYREIDISILKPILESKSIIKVGHNIKFEYLHILHNNNIRLNNVYDTMIVEQILYLGFGLPNGLKDLNERYLNIIVDKSIRLEFSKIGKKPFTLKQINYGAEDILYPILIRKEQLKELNKKQLTNCANLEMLFLLVLGDIEYKGMNFNKDLWLKNYEENLKIYKSKENLLNEFILENFTDTIYVNKQYDLFNSGFKCSIEWSSPQQVVNFLKYLNICPVEKGKYTSEAKVVKSSLNNINKDIDIKLKEFLKLYLEYKEYSQACSTFGKKFLEHINPITNRIHSNYKQILNTGRISSSGPNLQNIPAKKEFRRAFDAPKLNKIVNADYSGQEQIILANKSQDKDLVYFYEQNLGDMHSFVASKIFPEIADLELSSIKIHHKDKRQIAKDAGFAIN